jgi:hypothetical protein
MDCGTWYHAIFRRYDYERLEFRQKVGRRVVKTVSLLVYVQHMHNSFCYSGVRNV